MNLRFVFGILILSPGLDQGFKHRCHEKGCQFRGQYRVYPAKSNHPGWKDNRRGAFEMQSAQAISAAYDFNLAARDFILADSAIDSVVEAIPWSALIDPSQSRELIFCRQSDWP